ncbi:hypothetical protein ZOSMA_21G00730 [Zostera marina]|uniref:Pre-rRNA-processing protein RIX1 N-terminal domain-containing protein n=1 Tax=Zostera marina TaxID=29655 RepID=A0A0K9PJT7_ZOSMR|nr:hypothetical protein ZOSMA_21G00730 [Zostera marina]
MMDQRQPVLLRMQIRDHLPNEKTSVNFSHLLSAVSAVKSHGLLRESVSSKDNPKLAKNWKDAFDTWIDHVLSLVSSTMPDKQLAGINLLGITCLECSSDRFLVSYSGWFQRLYEIIQNPDYSHFIGVALCASFSDLLTRLADFPKLKKDATSLTAKIIQSVIQMLDNDTISADSLRVGAIRLLCTSVTFFPSTINRYYDRVEVSIVSKIMSGKYSTHVSKELAHCLALLPKARGGVENWSLMMQRVLIAINTLLDDAFDGLNEGNKSSHISRFLVPPGKVPPSPLGGHAIPKEESFVKRVQDLLVPRVFALTQCACTMLTASYSVQVVIPIHPLLAIIERVLLVDGSLPESPMFTTSLHQELLCSEIPSLQLHILDLLIAVIKGVRSQLLPFAARIARLLKEYIRSATFPHIRIKLYAIMQTLVISMGAGMVEYLSQEIVENVFTDLSHVTSGLNRFPSNNDISEDDVGFLHPTNHKKRKHDDGLSTKQQVSVEKPPALLSVQLAAIEALSVILTMGGSLINSLNWRSSVDNLLIIVATKAIDGEINFSVTDKSTPKFADLRLAALQALKVSLMSPGCVRPLYLYKGLEVFRRGKRETGTKIAAVCADALLSLEVLIHPRALQAIDLQLQNNTAFVRDHPDHVFLLNRKSAAKPESNICNLEVVVKADDWMVDGDIECEVKDDNERKTNHRENMDLFSVPSDRITFQDELAVQNGTPNQLQKMVYSSDVQSLEEEMLCGAPLNDADVASEHTVSRIESIAAPTSSTMDSDCAGDDGPRCSALLPVVHEDFHYDIDSDSDSLGFPMIENIESESD